MKYSGDAKKCMICKGGFYKINFCCPDCSFKLSIAIYGIIGGAIVLMGMALSIFSYQLKNAKGII